MTVFTVLGEGAWGTAIATLLAESGHTVYLRCHDHDVKNTIEKTRINSRYLPNIVLNALIIPVIDFHESIEKSDYIVEAIPVKFLRSILSQINPTVAANKPWIILSKGIENETLFFPSQIIDEFFGNDTKKAVLFGPSFALELAQKQITAVTLATHDQELGTHLSKLLDTSFFKTYPSADLMGVQLCGALKNVMALVLGMLTGAGYADNTKAFVVTRGLAEFQEILVLLGGQKETLYNLAGIGDLILTSYGKLSRNAMVGQKLGQGNSLENIFLETGAIPESINTLKSLKQLLDHKKIYAPFIQGAYTLIYENLLLEQFIHDLR